MMQSDVLLSVIIPVYNSEDTLARAIDSVLTCQTQTEIIVVDDASPGNCAEVLSDYPQVRLIRHELNKGLAEARKTGAQAAKGQYLVNLDADDWIENHIYDTAVMHLQRSANKVFMFSVREQGDEQHQERDKSHFLPQCTGVTGQHLLENLAMQPVSFIWHIGVNKVMEADLVRQLYRVYADLPKVNMLEDFLFSCLLFTLTEKSAVFSTSSDIGYVYFRSSASMTLNDNAERASQNIDDVDRVYRYLLKVIKHSTDVLPALGLRFNAVFKHWVRLTKDPVTTSWSDPERANQHILRLANKRIECAVNQLGTANWVVFGDGVVAEQFYVSLTRLGVNDIQHCRDDQSLADRLTILPATTPVLIGSIGSAEAIFRRLANQFPTHRIVSII